jgi:hypothetical protein
MNLHIPAFSSFAKQSEAKIAGDESISSFFSY